MKKKNKKKCIHFSMNDNVHIEQCTYCTMYILYNVHMYNKRTLYKYEFSRKRIQLHQIDFKLCSQCK